MHKRLLIIINHFKKFCDCGLTYARVARRVGVALQRRVPLVDGLWACEGYLWRASSRDQCSREPLNDTQCPDLPSISEMSGWRCPAGIPKTPSSGSDMRPSNVTSRTNQTTGASRPWRTPALWCAGVRVWGCWMQMTPLRMSWRIMTLSKLVMKNRLLWWRLMLFISILHI